MNPTPALSIDTVSYPLQAQGYIHHWLVAGPQAIAVADFSRFAPDQQRQAQIAAAYHQPTYPLTTAPAELTPLTLNDAHGAATLIWRAVRCGDDHLIDGTTFYPTWHYLRTWAYTELHSANATDATFVLASHGPAEVWINGTLVHHHTHFQRQLTSLTFTAPLQAGGNRLLVCFATVAVRACPYALALQVKDLEPAALTVQFPTTLPVKRRQAFEQIFDAAYLDKAIYHREDELILRWPAEFKLAGELTIRVQTPSGRIYTESHPSIRGGSVVKLGKVYQRPDGAYHVTIMPSPEDYHVHGFRILRHIPIHIANGKFSETAYGTYAERRTEALLDAIGRTANIYSEIAKMALGRWDKVVIERFTPTLNQIKQQADGSVLSLVGLLGALLRYGDDPAFPATLRAQIEACACDFAYWLDETGPAGAPDPICYWSENHQILFHTCQVLAGQLWPEQSFSKVNQPGRWHQQKGEERALAWLRKRAQGGFREWDSNLSFEHHVLALSHLTDLAENGEVAEMAAVVLDKLFFTMALNSFRGVFGSTHGSTDAPAIHSGRLELTSGLSRLLWGVGAFNEHMRGVVSLACAQRYELPPPIYEIGATPVEELWSKERHAGVMETWCDGSEGAWEVNKVTYKTPDYMLCSAQDYQPGAPGEQQHIWQATFGPDAVVFVTHPPCGSQGEAQRPNFWRGNAMLPRVAQWKDVLIALHKLPADDWLGFTHAYFPTVNFDETVIRNGWAFARKGDGYLALTAATGFTMTTTGDHAQHELRAYGQQQAWFCHLGRAAVDGGFAEFQNKIVALDISFDDLAVHATTLRNESIDFGWEGPLLINEVEQPLHDFRHYDSPFCVSELGADVMEIRAWQQGMQLDFRLGTVDSD